MTAPLVLIHGSFGRGADWAEVTSRWSRAALTPDLPGHGERFRVAATSFDDTVDELVRDLPPACDLVGYSLGGRLALAVALRASGVRSLVIESAHPGLDADQRVRRLAQDLERAQLLRTDPAAFFREFYETELFASARQHPEFEAILEARVRRAQRAPAILAETFAALSPGHQTPLGDALLRSEIPTLVVVGSLDAKYSQLGRDLMAAAPGRVRLAEVEGAGHNVHFEKPDEFATVLESFWSDVE